MSVTWVRVGDVFERSREPVDIDESQTYPYIGVRSFAKGLIRYDPTPAAQLSKMQYFRLEPGCLVVSNIKAWEGAVAVSAPGDETRIVSNRFHTYRPTERIDLRFAFHYFASARGTAALSAASPGSADRNRTLGAKNFEKLTIPLPDLPEQQRIAARLDAVADAASTMSQRTHDVASIRDRILGQATSTTPTPLRELATEDRNFTPTDTAEMYSIAGVLGHGRGMLSRPPIAGSETTYAKLKHVRSGQLIFSRLKAFEGAISLVDAERDGHFVSPEFPVFDLDTSLVSPSWLIQLLHSRWAHDQIAGLSKGVGARRERLAAKDFLSLTIPLPPFPEQQRIADLLGRLDEVERLTAHRAQLAAALLPAARNEEFSRLLADAPER